VSARKSKTKNVVFPKETVAHKVEELVETVVSAVKDVVHPHEEVDEAKLVFLKMQQFWQTGRGGPEIVEGLHGLKRAQLIYLSSLVPQCHDRSSTGRNLQWLQDQLMREVSDG